MAERYCCCSDSAASQPSSADALPPRPSGGGGKHKLQLRWPLKWPLDFGDGDAQSRSQREPPPAEVDFSDSALMNAVQDFFDNASWAELAAASAAAAGGGGTPGKGAMGARTDSKYDLLDVTAEMVGTDMLQLSSHGPRISYSPATAEWMAAVAQDGGSDARLVTDHLNG
eukprot:6586140-Prymnesium_polylepis.1